ncbi:LysR family transcriptional regulator [Tengunoibacter tsumagoiensis]|uniref:LysR family transcriptional regulator n=1 Tax=Tengunoibacter tsumagoiensis TaxID=2014871 RepID=A0A402A1S4_9CHLR|nr:LysR family transcriptional regulator [Tengunoibacter tsumagoiensis]GCE12999.1 LysR family transcriptional regulator [Tengunoibacter tsumagoiensis]
MNLQNLRIFLKVAELEHVTRAAEVLNLSQPAVTKIIQSLEREAHLKFVERQGRRIVLTQAGRVLQSYARRLFALEHEMDAALGALRDVEGGEVSLAVNTTAWTYLLPPIVARFRERYPRVRLQIAVLNSHEIMEKTLNWELDFGLIEGTATELPPPLQMHIFSQDRLILVASPQHPFAQKESISAEMICIGELLLREEGSGIREVIEQACRIQGLVIQPLLTLSDNEALKQMVMSGVGVTILSELVVQRELASGELVQLPMLDFALQAQLSLIQRNDKLLSPASQAFLRFLVAANTHSQFA